jgi:uncharacterized membrane protein YkoI
MKTAFAQSSAPPIPIKEAIRIARSAVPNAVIKEVELEREDRRLVWEVKFTNDIESRSMPLPVTLSISTTSTQEMPPA